MPSAPGQVGFPPSMNTDARLGYSAMEYQISELAFTSCDAGRSASARLVGQASKSHETPKKSLAQRAKVGSCTCCVPPSHVAAPAAYATGEWDDPEVRGIRPLGGSTSCYGSLCGGIRSGGGGMGRSGFHVLRFPRAISPHFPLYGY